MPAAIISDEDRGGSCYIYCAQQGLQTWGCLFIYHFTHRGATLLHSTADGAIARREIFATCLLCLNVAERVICSRKMPEQKISLKIPNFFCVLLAYSSWMGKSGIAYSPRSANPQVTKIQSCQTVLAPGTGTSKTHNIAVNYVSRVLIH